jgi:hypothetical protein
VSVQRAGLWDPSQALRFPPLALVEAQHSLATSADSQTVVDNDFVHEQETGTQDTENGAANGHEVLAYQIPEEKLRAAMLATPKTRASYWSAKLYEGPGGESINTHYCRSLEVAERVAQYFLKEKVVGFDIEWKPWGSPTSIKQNASLIQLACEDRIALFHIALFPGTKVEQLMPPSLKAVLESPDIYKVGVAVKGDFKRLEKHLDIQAQGIFELSRLHNLVQWYDIEPSKVTKKLVGLAAQVLQHLQLPLYKGEPLEDAPETKTSVRESDWSLPLDLEQIHYAAADAYAGFRLYHMLEWKRTRLRSTPPPIPVCDYDNKPLPKSSKPRKRTKAAKSKDAGKIDLAEEGQVAEQEAEQEGDDYETAPEELIDSHQLEDSTSASSPNAPRDIADVAVETHSAQSAEAQNQRRLERDVAAISAHKRIGRVNISRLKGADDTNNVTALGMDAAENQHDPGYPTLPKGLQEEVEGPSSTEQLNLSSDIPVERIDDHRPSQAQLLEAFNDSDDEFADPELEEALRRLDLDDTVRMSEETKETALRHTSSLASTGHNELEMLGSQDVQPATVAESNDSEVVDLSDFNPTSLATDEVDGTTAPTFEPSELSEEPSHTPEYTSATYWAREHLQSTIPSPTCTVPSRIRATVPHLRAVRDSDVRTVCETYTNFLHLHLVPLMGSSEAVD